MYKAAVAWVSFGHNSVTNKASYLLFEECYRAPFNRNKKSRKNNSSGKKGAYVESTRINGVTVSYWQGKGTLMIQGPRVATKDIDEFFIDHRKNKGKTTSETIRTNTRNAQATVAVGAIRQ